MGNFDIILLGFLKHERWLGKQLNKGSRRKS